METLNNIVLTIQDYMSNIVLIIALLGAGIWFSLAKRARRKTTV